MLVGYDLAVIQTACNEFQFRAINAPRNDEGTVLLDMCPKGTIEVTTHISAKHAAKHGKMSVSTYYRQLRLQGC